MKSKTTAILLCFFLGGLGVHWFYLNRPGLGILWLFTLGLFGIGTLINFIQLICMSDMTFNQKYNSVPVMTIPMPPRTSSPVNNSTSSSQ